MHDPTEDRFGSGRRAPGGGADAHEAESLAVERGAASSRDHADAISRALRDLRSAGALSAILAATDEVLRRSLGADAYAVVDATATGPRVVLTRGLEPHELASLSGESAGNIEALVASFQLGNRQASLGWLTICRLVPGKSKLGPFEFELLTSLRDAIAVALQHANEESEVPTVRPPSLSRLRTE